MALSMPESPDVPWARDHDPRGAPPKIPKAPEHAISFERFLNQKNIRNGRLIVLGCDHQSCASAAHFSKMGYEAYLVGERSPAIEDLDLHGVRIFTQNLRDHLLFEDDFFDLALDLSSDDINPKLVRVLRTGAFYSISGRIERK